MLQRVINESKFFDTHHPSEKVSRRHFLKDFLCQDGKTEGFNGSTPSLLLLVAGRYLVFISKRIHWKPVENRVNQMLRTHSTVPVVVEAFWAQPIRARYCEPAPLF
jgi:hypothetical protein